MLRLVLLALALIASLSTALAEVPPSTAPGVPVGTGTQPVVIYDAQGLALAADNPLPSLSMPFQRAGDPFIFPATATPTQYIVTQPLKTRSYRAVNPCLNADIRVKTVAATAPVVSEATAYPGVRRVTSATETVTAVTGTRFMGRYGETLGSTENPMGGAQRIISVMIVQVPGSTVDVSGFTCPFELGYGMGG